MRDVVTVSVIVAVVEEVDGTLPVPLPVEVPFAIELFGFSIRIVIFGVMFAVTLIVAFIPSTRGTDPKT